jgi:CheY-like chemotaxis protein
MPKTVMLVEDELFVAMDVQMTFEDEGWKAVGPFTNISEALEYLEGGTADCAIVDVRLIDGEAYPVADRLVELGIPFIFHSGHANARELEKRFPNAPFVGKPSLPIELVDVANHLTEVSARARA